MNGYVTTGTRELTAQEFDQVTGGFSRDASYEAGAVFLSVSLVAAVGGAIGSFLDWLFG
jgi:hypothetical protein